MNGTRKVSNFEISEEEYWKEIKMSKFQRFLYNSVILENLQRWLNLKIIFSSGIKKEIYGWLSYRLSIIRGFIRFIKIDTK